SFENEVEVSYNHEGDDDDRIEKDTYFAYDSFYFLPEGTTDNTYRVIVDVTIDSVMDEEGLIIKVRNNKEGGKERIIRNATVFIDGEHVGKTNEMGEFSWEEKGDPVVHFRNKGTHIFRVKYLHENVTKFEGGDFLIGSPKNRMGIDYDLRNFLLVGVLFWAFFGKAYEDTVNTIPEEASRGTIGFLVTSNVSISTLLLSRNIASSIKTFIITMIFIIPPFYLLGVFAGFRITDLPLLLLVFGLMWLFMLVVSLFISSLNIIFKKITPAAMMIMYGLKVLTGYYFPLEALDEYAPGLSDKIKIIPLVRGAYFIRDVIIIGKDIGDAMSAIKEMFIYTMVLAVVTFIFYKILEYKSQRWGTLEFY
ncbi:MAG: ABC transporter permease, partial [Thermoplasmata archaeon]|nr:ABC transporter permease [Thermoplasmata archaeon]